MLHGPLIQHVGCWLQRLQLREGPAQPSGLECRHSAADGQSASMQWMGLTVAPVIPLSLGCERQAGEQMLVTGPLLRGLFVMFLMRKGLA